MRKLIKKILRESDDLDWVRDVEPSFLEILKAATEHDDRINVYLHNDGTLQSIRDEAGYRYMGDWDFNHLPDGYDDKTLLDSILRKVEWEIVDFERDYDEDSLASHKDYQDFLHLRNTIERLFSKKTLKESDDLDWIRDTQPINYEYLKGKALHFQPLIDNGRDLDRILNFLRNLGFNVDVVYDIELVKVDEGELVEGLYLNPKDNVVAWTGNLSYYGEDYEEHISEWAGIPVEVLDGWRTLEDYI